MKRIVLFSSFATILLFFSCKKKQTTPESAQAPVQIFSDLQANYSVTNYNNNVIVKDSSVKAYFYTNPGKPTFVNAGDVSLNSNNLYFNPSNKYYIAYPSSLNITGILSWNVLGSG